MVMVMVVALIVVMAGVRHECKFVPPGVNSVARVFENLGRTLALGGTDPMDCRAQGVR